MAGVLEPGGGKVQGNDDGTPAAAAAPALLRPWDVAYAQQQLMCSHGLDVQYAEVEAYMSLRGIVEVGLHEPARHCRGGLT